MMKMTKKIAAMVMTGALIAAMSVPAFAGVASRDVSTMTAKEIYSYAAAAYVNAYNEAVAAQTATTAAETPVVTADGTVYASYSEYAAALANQARAAFEAQGIGNAAALGYGVN